MRRIARLLAITAPLLGCSLAADLSGLSSGSSPSNADASAPGTDGGVLTDGQTIAPEGDGSTSASAYAAAVREDLPRAWFRFEDMGGPSARDEIGGASGVYASAGVEYGKTGAMTGSRAIHLDGQSGRVSLGARFPFVGTQAFTLEMWVYPDFVDDKVRRLIGREGATGPASYQIQSVEGGSLFQRSATGGDTYGGNNQLVPNRWTHVVATYSTAGAILYLDAVGGERGNASGTLADPAGAELCVGDMASSNFYKFSGFVDEVAIYDKVLPEARIRAHFDAARR